MASPLHTLRAAVSSLARAVFQKRFLRVLRAARHWAILNENNRRLRKGSPSERLKPERLSIEGTNICNAECVFCAYPQMKRPKKVMDLELFKRVVSEYAELGGDMVDLTPIVGDPFVDGKLFERMDFMTGLAPIRQFHFFTNAIGMKPRLCDRLFAYEKKLLVNISFGGFDRETYHRVMGTDHFETVVANIRFLVEAKRERKAKLRIALNLRTPEQNHRGPLFEEMMAWEKEGLIEVTWISEYDSWGGAISDEDLAKEGLKARPMPEKPGVCYRLLSSPTVLVDGRVNGCACRDVEAELVIGDLNKESLADVLSGRALKDLIARQERGDFPEICRKCTYYNPITFGWTLKSGFFEEPAVPKQ